MDQVAETVARRLREAIVTEQVYVATSFVPYQHLTTFRWAGETPEDSVPL